MDDGTRDPGRLGLRTAIAAVTAAAAVPYGYTVTLWSTGAVLTHVHGIPDLAEVAVFIAGALAAFGGLGLLVPAEPDARAEARLARGRTRVVSGALNWLAVGAAVGSAAVLAHVGTVLAWGLASCGATVIFLLLASAQLALAARRG